MSERRGLARKDSSPPISTVNIAIGRRPVITHRAHVVWGLHRDQVEVISRAGRDEVMCTIYSDSDPM